MGKPTPKDEIPLQPLISLEPFDMLGMVFIGPIDPQLGKKRYIIVCIDYLTKWAEIKAMKIQTEDKVAEFLRENVFYKFGYTREVATDQGDQFTSHLIESLLRKHGLMDENALPIILEPMDK